MINKSSLEHVDSPRFSFRESGSDFRWIEARRFLTRGVAMNNSDDAIISALIRNPWYEDGFDSAESPQPGRRVHGPYRLEAIGSDSFVPIGRECALNHVQVWANIYGPLPDQFSVRLHDFMNDLLPVGFRVWELPDMRAVAEHEAGRIVGDDGFLEFIAISPDRKNVNLIIASDD